MYSNFFESNDFPKCDVTQIEHQKRQALHLLSGNWFIQSLEDFDYSTLEKLNIGAELPDSVPMQTNPKWINYPFGAVASVSDAGCINFVAKGILDYFGYNEISVKEIIDVVVYKGYRKWKLSNRPKTLGLPKFTLEAIKKEFPLDEEIQGASTLEEVIETAGSPVGIGGSMFFIDTLIKQLSLNDFAFIETWQNITREYDYEYCSTRITSIEQLIENLEEGFPIPCRIENAIYHDDASRKGGHYVILYRIDNGIATIADSNYGNGIRQMSAEQFINSLVGNKNLTCIWDLKRVVL